MMEHTKITEQNEKQNAKRVSHSALYGFMKQGPATTGSRDHWTDDLVGPSAYRTPNVQDEDN
jgi:hypothetical protein